MQIKKPTQRRILRRVPATKPNHEVCNISKPMPKNIKSCSTICPFGENGQSVNKNPASINNIAATNCLISGSSNNILTNLLLSNFFRDGP